MLGRLGTYTVDMTDTMAAGPAGHASSCKGLCHNGIYFVNATDMETRESLQKKGSRGQNMSQNVQSGYAVNAKGPPTQRKRNRKAGPNHGWEPAQPFVAEEVVLALR